MGKLSMGALWTTQQERRLLEMEAQGLPHKVIGAELGRSVWAVRCRLSRIRLQSEGPCPRPHHKWRVSELAELRELYRKGLTGREIAERLGVSTAAVHNKVAELRRSNKLY